MKKVLAIDFGASGGKAFLGEFDGEKINPVPIHRFPNDPVEIDGNLYWDVLRLFHEIKQSLLKAPKDISSVGIDTWGVDYGLLDQDDNLISNPRHYRDKRTDATFKQAMETIGNEFIYNKTGIQTIFFNTIYQLMAEKNLERAKTLLFMPDLFNYFLTGEKRAEQTISSTSQLLDHNTGCWSQELLEKINVKKDLFPSFIEPSKVCGHIHKSLEEELNLNPIAVISVASHDTASAVVSVPFENPETSCFLSCGTWSLLGAELDKPCVSEAAKTHNFTNEGGAFGTTRFLKNIMGLWLVQECMAQWTRESDEISFAQLDPQTEAQKPFVSFIDPDDIIFAPPGNMPKRIRNYCMQTGQKVPIEKPEIIRVILDSLAFKYRYTVENMEEILGRKIETIHMVGGGIRDILLCKSTANITGRTVLAGPIEATAAGNIIMQLIATDQIKDLSHGRRIIKNSFPIVKYEPDEIADLEQHYERFKRVIKTA